MIRREATDPDGKPAWILISQVEHARLSAEVARHWGAGGVLPLEPRDELLTTIAHHDDGWAAWEERPSIDPAHGRPYDFMEMPLEEALPIWDRSIAVAQRLAGRLGGWLVASHFCVLLRRGRDAHPHPADYVERADAWLVEADQHRARWLAEWQRRNPARHTAELADRGLAQLQMFDALSLWFCCADREAPKRLSTPTGPSIVLSPTGGQAVATRSAGGCLGQTVRVAPWPFTVPAVELSTSGRLVAADRFADASALAAAPSAIVRLAWVLQPS